MSNIHTNFNLFKQKLLAKYDQKRIDLFTAWLEVWTRYIDEEATFNPQSRKVYNPGDVVTVCLGFNVGSEQGGNRPAVVIGINDHKNKTIRIVPLGSLNPNDNPKRLYKGEVFLDVIPQLNTFTKKPHNTRSKALTLHLRTISKQRIIHPTTDQELCINIGPEKLKLIEQDLIQTIQTIP